MSNIAADRRPMTFSAAGRKALRAVREFGTRNPPKPTHRVITGPVAFTIGACAAVAAFSVPALVLTMAVSGYEGIESFIGWGLATLFIIAIVSIPALPLSVAAALLLRPVRSQVVHVLAFGLAGLAACTPLILAAVFGEPAQSGVGIELLIVCASAVICAMGGRLLIWPLVRTIDAANGQSRRLPSNDGH